MMIRSLVVNACFPFLFVPSGSLGLPGFHRFPFVRWAPLLYTLVVQVTGTETAISQPRRNRTSVRHSDPVSSSPRAPHAPRAAAAASAAAGHTGGFREPCEPLALVIASHHAPTIRLRLQPHTCLAATAAAMTQQGVGLLGPTSVPLTRTLAAHCVAAQLAFTCAYMCLQEWRRRPLSCPCSCRLPRCSTAPGVPTAPPVPVRAVYPA